MAANGCGRTAAIQDAVRRQLELRRALFDGAEDLGQVTVTVKLQAGTSWVRGVIVEDERVFRTGRMEDGRGR